MPIVDRDIERKIVEEGLRRNNEPEAIKSAVLKFRESVKPLQEESSTLGKVGRFVGNITGISGVVKGVSEATKVAKGLITGKEFAPTISPAQFAGSAGKLGLTAGTLGTSGLGVSLGVRALESGIIGVTFQALSNLEKKEKLTKGLVSTGAISSAIPVAGTALSQGRKLLGKATAGTGEKILTSIIKPTRTDIEDGFSVQTIKKYNLGGSLQEMARNTESKLNSLGKELAKKIGKAEESIDLNKVSKLTASQLLKEKAKTFGNIAGIRRALQSLSGEVDEVSSSGIVNLVDAQAVKQAAGQKGSWVFGFVDPDAKAIEQVYTTFYRNLRKEIENKAPAGVREVNRQLAELIPINHAIIRRIPVTERQNLLSLTDIVGAAGSLLSPYSLGVIAAGRLSKSGTVGSALLNLGQKIQQRKPKTFIGQRIFGR